MHIWNIPQDTTSIAYAYLKHSIRYNKYIFVVSDETFQICISYTCCTGVSDGMFQICISYACCIWWNALSMHKLYLLYLMECCSGWSTHAIVTSYRYTDTLQVYGQPTSIQTPYKYTVSRIQVRTPKIQIHTRKIQVQTPKIQVQAPKYKSRHPKYKNLECWKHNVI